MRIRKTEQGYTLIGILFLLIVIMILLAISFATSQVKYEQNKVDKTILQMQQILNAGLSYYVTSGNVGWPAPKLPSKLTLTGNNAMQPTYLPNQLVNAWGNNFVVSGTPELFYVWTKINAGSLTPGITFAIAGRLPLAYTSDLNEDPPNPNSPCKYTDTVCYVVTTVNPPGHNLSNATAVNYAGVYSHGGCVPVPECPYDKNGNKLQPVVTVSPVSLSGTADPANPNTLTPLAGFTASALNDNGNYDNTPYACPIGNNPSTGAKICESSSGVPINSGKYWRVCLQVISSSGDVATLNPTWGSQQAVAAFTRCAISNTTTGSDFTVYTP